MPQGRDVLREHAGKQVTRGWSSLVRLLDRP